MSEAAEEIRSIESAATPERQAKAESMGWIPPARYRGDPDRFVDADDYIRRGEEVLPIVKKQLETTRAELAALTANQKSTEAALAAAQEALRQIELQNSVATQKAVEKAKAEVKAQLARASEAGDHDGVAELTEQLVELNDAAKAAPPPKEPAKPAAWTPSPDIVAWNAANTWYGTDPIKTALANGVAQKLRSEGNTAVGAAFLDQVKASMEEVLAPAAPPADKALGGRNGSEHEPRAGGRKGYASMPADARAQCDADAKQFVGPNKTYKTVSEWREAFAQIYHGE